MLLNLPQAAAAAVVVAVLAQKQQQLQHPHQQQSKLHRASLKKAQSTFAGMDTVT